jgi:hypothetical protein
VYNARGFCDFWEKILQTWLITQRNYLELIMPKFKVLIEGELALVYAVQSN